MTFTEWPPLRRGVINEVTLFTEWSRLLTGVGRTRNVVYSGQLMENTLLCD